jgi:4-alpha-glucanotransferase
MNFPRSSGVLLHPTSLPGRYGIGELGREAFEFLDFLKAAGQSLWQVLPISPTGYADSPYQSFSSFAGNPLLISLDKMAGEGLLDAHTLAGAPHFPAGRVDFGTVIPFKKARLREAARNFFSHSAAAEREAFEIFRQNNSSWLPDFALFMAAKDAHEGAVWSEWEPSLAQRRPDAIAAWREDLALPIAQHEFFQYEFFRQWSQLKWRCGELGIQLMGDVPIYVAHDSADVWAHPEFFSLDAKCRPQAVAGVPPDYFSATGQLWGNPVYRWDRLAADGYKWWIERMRAAFSLYDIVRLDHFRGFEAFWEIPAGETTAIHGHWVKGPGAEFFTVLREALGERPIVAENLGVITPEVESLRQQFGMPGMAIAQFAFGKDMRAPAFRPHNYIRDLVVYTGTHDNDTICGWWHSGAEGSTRTEEEVQHEKDATAAYFGVSRRLLDEEVNWIFIRQVMMTIASTVIFPVQDLLGLGGEARMNLPGTTNGNWQWRMHPGALTARLAGKLKELVRLYDRGGQPQG